MRTRLTKSVGFLALALCLAAACSCTTVTQNRISAPVPFVTTPPSVVSAMLKLADVTGSDIVYDLGSGDGRIVIAAARDFGARAVGVEIDPKLIQESERNAESAGVSSRVRFIQQDLFQADITEATVVTLFLLPGVNAVLAPKLLKELKPGTRVVSYWYDMGEWQPDKTVRADTLAVYYWVVPADVGGMWTLQIPTAEGVGPQILSLRQAFQRISGSVRLNGRKLDLRDPRIDGEHLSFTASGAIGGEPVLMRFSGHVQGGQAAGVVEVKGGAFSGSHRWVAQRPPK
jgi:protein-L-isoaspartate O-methyltransferase